MKTVFGRGVRCVSSVGRIKIKPIFKTHSSPPPLSVRPRGEKTVKIIIKNLIVIGRWRTRSVVYGRRTTAIIIHTRCYYYISAVLGFNPFFTRTSYLRCCATAVAFQLRNTTNTNITHTHACAFYFCENRIENCPDTVGRTHTTGGSFLQRAPPNSPRGINFPGQNVRRVFHRSASTNLTATPGATRAAPERLIDARLPRRQKRTSAMIFFLFFFFFVYPTFDGLTSLSVTDHRPFAHG